MGQAGNPAAATRVLPATRMQRVFGHIGPAWDTWPPIVYLLFGLLIAAVWLYSNMIQMRTSEEWMFHLLGTNAIPPYDPIKQIGDVLAGHADATAIKAYTWGWFVQIALFISALGLARVHDVIHRKYNAGTTTSLTASKSSGRKGIVFNVACFILFGLNSLADLQFTASSLWGQLLFAGIILMASYFFGQLAIHLIVAGIEGLKGN
jgi:hypothetical protein